MRLALLLAWLWQQTAWSGLSLYALASARSDRWRVRYHRLRQDR